MSDIDLATRMKQFAIRILRLTESLDRSITGRTIAGQLARCGTSVAANYRAARRARSKAEFLAKLGIVEEEADECCFWLDLIVETGLMKKERVQALLTEANELLAITVASRKTMKSHIHRTTSSGDKHP